ncbi:hypothetical protein B0H13DRAFT_2304205 [Mycena leptocephala]|nr:hypothetical protein B0H13DRAFT_2304205 [Mycena leptocephala]
MDSHLSASSPRLLLLPFPASCFSSYKYNAPAGRVPSHVPCLTTAPLDIFNPFIARPSTQLVHLTSPYPRRPHAQQTTPSFFLLTSVHPRLSALNQSKYTPTALPRPTRLPPSPVLRSRRLRFSRLPPLLLTSPYPEIANDLPHM